MSLGVVALALAVGATLPFRRTVVWPWAVGATVFAVAAHVLVVLRHADAAPGSGEIVAASMTLAAVAAAWVAAMLALAVVALWRARRGR